MSLTLVRSFGVAAECGQPVTGRRKFGVPVGGAFDQESFALTCALCGRDIADPVWELGLAQGSFRAEASGVVAIVGASCVVRMGSDVCDGNIALAVNAGDEFVVETPSAGARVYVGFGPRAKSKPWRMRLDEPPSSFASRSVVRIMRGPQAEDFPPDWLGRTFTVSRNSNRIGVRLEESIGGHSIELPSEPQCVGTIQVPNDGSPIVIGPDGPTIGGYPKVGVVISCDVDRVGQLRPGDSVSFEAVSIETARAACREAAQNLARKIGLLRLSSQ